MHTTARTPLTRLDRCDRCGAAAVLRAVLATGGELLFCGHHAREHGPALHVLEAQLTIELSETHSSARRRVAAVPGAGGTPSNRCSS
jgi:hypothetical protein